jgi:DNA polymerase-3 subunit beta
MQLEDALDRASLLSRIDKNNLVKFEVNDKLMVLSSKSDIGDIKENITIALNGKDLTIAFNARYFTEALRVITDEFIKLNFTTTVAPCIITSNESNEFLYLILPVRLI